MTGPHDPVANPGDTQPFLDLGVSKPVVLVARCLAGEACRFHGRPTPPRKRLLNRLARRYDVKLVCPEQLGGLPTPRPPAEIVDGRVVSGGCDVTEAFKRGAETVLEIAHACAAVKFYGVRNSPSCDPRSGVTATRLADNGIQVRGG
jgi:uncharacterized protein YbbK (DUF523 family)